MDQLNKSMPKCDNFPNFGTFNNLPFMSVKTSFKAQLTSYHQNFIQKPTIARTRFDQLKRLHENYINDVEDLQLMKYGTSIITEERKYDNLKSLCKTEHQQLKQQQKILDERTLAIEQQLYLGLPNDLKEMEKVILEQESILEDQQQVNQVEEQLLEKMRKIDIEHGKVLANLEQAYATNTPPIQNEIKFFHERIDVAANKIIKKTKLFSLLPILIIPIVLDVLVQQTGLQDSGENHFIFSHYTFLISLILLEIFASSWIKSRITNQLSNSSCTQILSELEITWTENQQQMNKLENESGFSLSEIKTTLADPISGK